MPGDQNDNTDELQNEPLPVPAPADAPGQQPANGNAQQAQAGQPGANNSDPNNPAAAGLNAVNKSLRQPGPTPTSSKNSFGSNTFGRLNSGGGIAGVASKAKGSTIKTMDGQTDFSKWEFVYNPQKDALAGMQGAANRMNSNANNPNSPNSNNSGAGFASPSSGFGSSSFGSNSSGFGSKSSGFGSSSSGFGSSSSGFGSSGFGSSTPSQSRTPSR
jgi:hypothetical protein